MAADRPPITIPAALSPLVGQPRWVVWKWETGKNGEPTKPPYQGSAPERKASSVDAGTWCAFETAEQTYNAGSADGIGFALQGSGIAAFDVDDCRNAASGELHPWASGLIARCGTYAEITPSGTGVRIIGTAAGPKVHRKLAVPGADGVSVELYRNAERYICVTGVQIGDAAQLSNIDAHINTAMADLAGPKLAGKREHNLEALVRDGCGDDFGGDRSRAVWYVVNQLLKDGKSADDVVAVLLDRANGISAHVYDQSKPEAYARRQVEKAQRQAEKTTTPSKDKRPAKDILIELAQNAELFHTADGVSYADFVIHNHRETWPVRAKGFKRWLGRLYTKRLVAPRTQRQCRAHSGS